MARHHIVILHRYVGLVMAGFLIIAGLTGALLVWYQELDTGINSQLLRVNPPAHTCQPLSPFALRNNVARAFPAADVNWMTLQRPSPADVYRFSLDPATDAETDTATLAFDEVFVDPCSGDILGGRQWGEITQGLKNLMPFIYRLHYALASGSVGSWLLGIVALLWTIDCFAGIYLTFPRGGRNGRVNPSPWLKRWWPAWKIRWRGGSYKLNFDLHTAGSLWLWALLLTFSWSSVAMTLYPEVYKPTMARFMTFQDNPSEELPVVAEPQRYPEIGWEQGLRTAKQQLETLALARNFQIEALERFAYYPEKGALKLMARTSRDINERFGQTWIYIDAVNGDLKGFYLPTGEASGDTFTTWITTLHIAGIWGLPYRVLVTVTGGFVVILSVTGVVLWWRKQRARKRSASLHKRNN